MVLGLVDEDEEVSEVMDRAYWEKRATPATLAAADELIAILRGIDADIEPKYNKFYIGLAKDGSANNFVLVQPKKSHVELGIRLSKTDDVESKLDESGLDLMEYNQKASRYRIRLKPGEPESHKTLLEELFLQSHSEWGG